MDFDEYSRKARSTAVYPNIGHNKIYPVLGLCGEAGEVAEKVKKMIRDGTPVQDVREFLGDELGDVLWYVNQIAVEFNLDLDEIAKNNIDKLFSRRDRGKLQGSGDDR